MSMSNRHSVSLAEANLLLPNNDNNSNSNSNSNNNNNNNNNNNDNNNDNDIKGIHGMNYTLKLNKLKSNNTVGGIQTTLQRKGSGSNNQKSHHYYPSLLDSSFTNGASNPNFINTTTNSNTTPTTPTFRTLPSLLKTPSNKKLTYFSIIESNLDKFPINVSPLIIFSKQRKISTTVIPIGDVTGKLIPATTSTGLPSSSAKNYKLYCNQYKILENLGSGQFAKVYKGITPVGSLVALKTFRKKPLNSSQYSFQQIQTYLSRNSNTINTFASSVSSNNNSNTTTINSFSGSNAGHNNNNAINNTINTLNSVDSIVMYMNVTKIRWEIYVMTRLSEKISKSSNNCSKIGSENVIKLLDCIDSNKSKKIWVITEFAEFGELDWNDLHQQYKLIMGSTTVLHQDNNYYYYLPNYDFNRFILDIYKDLVLGLYFLYCKGLVHRDIKPSNILLFKNAHTSYRNSPIIAKLSDFGTAIIHPDHLPSSESMGINNKEILFDCYQNELNKIVGTPAFIPPEVCNFKHNGGDVSITTPLDGFQLDMWSLGVTMFTLIYGCLPFEGDNEFETFDKIVNLELNLENLKYRVGIKNTDDANGFKIERLVNLMNYRMLCKQPHERCTILELVKDTELISIQNISQNDAEMSFTDHSNKHIHNSHSTLSNAVPASSSNSDSEYATERDSTASVNNSSNLEHGTTESYLHLSKSISSLRLNGKNHHAATTINNDNNNADTTTDNIVSATTAAVTTTDNNNNNNNNSTSNGKDTHNGRFFKRKSSKSSLSILSPLKHDRNHGDSNVSTNETPSKIFHNAINYSNRSTSNGSFGKILANNDNISMYSSSNNNTPIKKKRSISSLAGSINSHKINPFQSSSLHKRAESNVGAGINSSSSSSSKLRQIGGLLFHKFASSSSSNSLHSKNNGNNDTSGTSLPVSNATIANNIEPIMNSSQLGPAPTTVTVNTIQNNVDDINTTNNHHKHNHNNSSSSTLKAKVNNGGTNTDVFPTIFHPTNVTHLSEGNEGISISSSSDSGIDSDDNINSIIQEEEDEYSGDDDYDEDNDGDDDYDDDYDYDPVKKVNTNELLKRGKLESANDIFGENKNTNNVHGYVYDDDGDDDDDEYNANEKHRKNYKNLDTIETRRKSNLLPSRGTLDMSKYLDQLDAIFEINSDDNNSNNNIQTNDNTKYNDNIDANSITKGKNVEVMISGKNDANQDNNNLTYTANNTQQSDEARNAVTDSKGEFETVDELRRYLQFADD
ncbi:serine/threonine protein kinase ELM1 SCDLUD_004148 [Saccharomycodes ludwigii]|uniref:serine/threonine protein kinase ELM1 n=1 Tax=Saccharomycodes ludwigii TaxID=36035 RepID=UPI001E85191C|nr:hypothetical protein SCDLUD_004148 [Saccharomycodes ludwigii]KAH3899850.1 hypothetical protein SCDLUD_004148 [Saccharomycodes ludwigii]